MKNYSLLFFAILLLATACRWKEDPEPSCKNPEVFKIPAFATVVSNEEEIENGDNSGTYRVCAGGKLTLSGTDNLVLVDSGGVLVLNGLQNEAFILGGAHATVNGKDNELWLNGESTTYVYGFENQMYYYRIAYLHDFGDGTYVEELCANVEVDDSDAPIDCGG